MRMLLIVACAIVLAGCAPADDRIEPCKGHGGLKEYVDAGWDGERYICEDGTVKKE